MFNKTKDESLAQLGAATRTLLHEIKNPLSAMAIQSALLRSEIPQQFHGDLDILDHEIQRLTNLTKSVGEFLKNPLGTDCEIELISFIHDIIQLFPTDIKFHYDSFKNVFIVFDKDRARSVIENLIKNACESSSIHNPQVEIFIKSDRKKNRIALEICDRGNGIPKAVKDKIFDPFFTTKQNGSGIGLAISKQFIEARNGSLKLLDRTGGGTVAKIVLPAKIEKFKGPEK